LKAWSRQLDCNAAKNRQGYAKNCQAFFKKWTAMKPIIKNRLGGPWRNLGGTWRRYKLKAYTGLETHHQKRLAHKAVLGL
jgi:hypothetical protein